MEAIDRSDPLAAWRRPEHQRRCSYVLKAALADGLKDPAVPARLTTQGMEIASGSVAAYGRFKCAKSGRWKPVGRASRARSE